MAKFVKHDIVMRTPALVTASAQRVGAIFSSDNAIFLYWRKDATTTQWSWHDVGETGGVMP
jgi:hypothetical protein